MGEIEDMFPTELDDLPNEIISLILVKLCRHCSLGSATTPLAYSSTSTLREWTQPWPYSSERKALHALSLVSKRFRALAQPLLYHAAVIRYSGLSVDQAWPAHRDSFSNRVRPFLRTLTQRPDLAAAVQGVYLHVALVSPLNLGQCWQAVLEAEETGESFELPDLESELHDYPSGPALVLLITRLPSLAWIGYAGGLLFRSTPTATHTPGTFPGFRIERLELNGSSKEFHNLHHLIQKASPTMNTFCIDNCYPQSLEDLGPCPKLRNIYVTNCRPHGELHGRQFLTCSDRLETFTYDAGKLCLAPWLRPTTPWMLFFPQL
jgi:hypothetical protein